MIGVEETIDAKATLEIGGETVDLDGVDDLPVIAPTVLSDVTNDMVAACSEHFGPLAPTISFSSINGAAELANATEDELFGSVHAGDVGTGKRVAERIETDRIHVNNQPIDY